MNEGQLIRPLQSNSLSSRFMLNFCSGLPSFSSVVPPIGVVNHPWHLHCLGGHGRDEWIFSVQTTAPPHWVRCAQEMTRSGEWKEENSKKKKKSKTKHINYALWSNKQATTRQSTTMTTPSANIKRVAATPTTAHLHGALSFRLFFVLHRILDSESWHKHTRRTYHT